MKLVEVVNHDARTLWRAGGADVMVTRWAVSALRRVDRSELYGITQPTLLTLDRFHSMCNSCQSKVEGDG